MEILCIGSVVEVAVVTVCTVHGTQMVGSLCNGVFMAYVLPSTDTIKEAPQQRLHII
jgi:hypothetical protein